jgi:chaperonin GroES
LKLFFSTALGLSFRFATKSKPNQTSKSNSKLIASVPLQTQEASPDSSHFFSTVASFVRNQRQDFTKHPKSIGIQPQFFPRFSSSFLLITLPRQHCQHLVTIPMHKSAPKVQKQKKAQKSPQRKLTTAKKQQKSPSKVALKAQKVQFSTDVPQVQFQPNSNRILVRKDAIEKPKTASGILLPSQTKSAVPLATIVAVGPGLRNGEGKYVPTFTRPGDRVVLPDFGGFEVKMDSESFFVYRDDDILGIVSPVNVAERTAAV